MEDLFTRATVAQKYPDLDTVLLQVATIILNQNEDAVSIEMLQGVDIKQVCELGLLTCVDQVVAFADAALLREYIVRHCADLVDVEWDKIESFTRKLGEIEHRARRFGTPRELGKDILLTLATEHGRDVVGRVGDVAASFSADNRSSGFWTLYVPFCEALPELNAAPDQLAQTLGIVLRSEANDLAGGRIYPAVERTASQSRERAESLYQVFHAHPDDATVAITADILRGLARFDFAKAHGRAIEMLLSDRLIVRRTGIAALGTLNYSDTEENFLAETLVQLEAIRVQKESSIDDVLVRAYGDLLTFTDTSKQTLQSFSAYENSTVQFQVAFVLFRSSDKHQHELWFQSALFNLAIVDSAHKGTIEYLDYCAAQLVESQPEFVISFLRSFVISRNYHTEAEGAQLQELFNSTFDQLYRNHRSTLEILITSWFAERNMALHFAAQDVLMDAHHEQPVPIELSKTALDDLDDSSIQIVAQRICGHLHTGKILAALLLSILKREPSTLR